MRCHQSPERPAPLLAVVVQRVEVQQVVQLAALRQAPLERPQVLRVLLVPAPGWPLVPPPLVLALVRQS